MAVKSLFYYYMKIGRQCDPKKLRRAKRLMKRILDRGPSPCCQASILESKKDGRFCSMCFKDVK